MDFSSDASIYVLIGSIVIAVLAWGIKQGLEALREWDLLKRPEYYGVFSVAERAVKSAVVFGVESDAVTDYVVGTLKKVFPKMSDAEAIAIAGAAVYELKASLDLQVGTE